MLAAEASNAWARDGLPATTDIEVNGFTGWVACWGSITTDLPLCFSEITWVSFFVTEMVTLLLEGILLMAEATECALAIAAPSPVTVIWVLCFVGIVLMALAAARALPLAPSCAVIFVLWLLGMLLMAEEALFAIDAAFPEALMLMCLLEGILETADFTLVATDFAFPLAVSEMCLEPLMPCRADLICFTLLRALPPALIVIFLLFPLIPRKAVLICLTLLRALPPAVILIFWDFFSPLSPLSDLLRLLVSAWSLIFWPLPLPKLERLLLSALVSAWSLTFWPLPFPSLLILLLRALVSAWSLTLVPLPLPILEIDLDKPLVSACNLTLWPLLPLPNSLSSGFFAPPNIFLKFGILILLRPLNILLKFGILIFLRPPRALLRLGSFILFKPLNILLKSGILKFLPNRNLPAPLSPILARLPRPPAKPFLANPFPILLKIPFLANGFRLPNKNFPTAFASILARLPRPPKIPPRLKPLPIFPNQPFLPNSPFFLNKPWTPRSILFASFPCHPLPEPLQSPAVSNGNELLLLFLERRCAAFRAWRSNLSQSASLYFFHWLSESCPFLRSPLTNFSRSLSFFNDLSWLWSCLLVNWALPSAALRAILAVLAVPFLVKFLLYHFICLSTSSALIAPLLTALSRACLNWVRFNSPCFEPPFANWATCSPNLDGESLFPKATPTTWLRFALPVANCSPSFTGSPDPAYFAMFLAAVISMWFPSYFIPRPFSNLLRYFLSFILLAFRRSILAIFTLPFSSSKKLSASFSDPLTPFLLCHRWSVFACFWSAFRQFEYWLLYWASTPKILSPAAPCFSAHLVQLPIPPLASFLIALKLPPLPIAFRTVFNPFSALFIASESFDPLNDRRRFASERAILRRSL